MLVKKKKFNDEVTSYNFQTLLNIYLPGHILCVLSNLNDNYFLIIIKLYDLINVLYCFLLNYSKFQLNISINVEMRRPKKKRR